ncbi:hypothetical protein GCM10011579_065390 [Streptomyces albiflavescens]|uniref:Phosphoglycerate mutase n=1 Tax=Streptomyces albiflavescens TaxID=1623582 RepID=A0A918D8F5_9ACTN|nr:histidine phosphatase family protein [Streptomyces albiflavescens]GGN80147.1 hypothetical protein GCM10011579_065390 [Streptomyces albiflavescens]
MTVCLTFVCAITGDSTRTFGGGSPYPALRAAAAATPAFSPYSLAVRGPSALCAQTADSLGLETTPEPALSDFDYGEWDSRTVADVVAENPHRFSLWLTDPDAAPHGGESVRQICRRIGEWMNSVPSDTGRVLAVTESSVIRAALVNALSVPARAFWHFDVPPLSALSLTRREGQWHIRLGHVSPGRSGGWIMRSNSERSSGPRAPQSVPTAHSRTYAVTHVP